MYGGVETEGEVSSGQIIVNGLGHADDRRTSLVETGGYTERILAPDGDQSVAAGIAQSGLRPLDPVVLRTGVRAGCSQDRAPLVGNAVAGVGRPLAETVFKRAAPAAVEYHEFVGGALSPDDRGAETG